MVMVVKKKAQSALEFLTTYGWAFLVILIMIGALSYFGVLDPSRFLPDKCIFGTGVGACQDFGVLTNGNIVFKITNSLGSPVNFVGPNNASLTIAGISTACPNPVIQGNLSVGASVSSGASALSQIGTWNSSTTLFVNVSGCTVLVGERPTIEVTFTYLPIGSSYNKVVTGEVSVKRIQ